MGKKKQGQNIKRCFKLCLETFFLYHGFCNVLLIVFSSILTAYTDAYAEFQRLK